MWTSVGLVFGGRILTAAGGFAVVLLIARFLGPADYGRFALFVATMNVVAGLVGPAIDASMVRCAARHLSHDRDSAVGYFRVGLRIKGWLCVACLAIGLLGMRPLAGAIFGPANDPGQSASLVALAFVGATFMMAWGYAQACFQTHQQFAKYAAYEVLNSVLRLVLAASVVWSGRSDVYWFAAAYAMSVFVVGLGSLIQLPREFLVGERPVRREAVAQVTLAREFLRFAKWVIVASFATSLAQRADLFLLSGFRVSAESLGHYGAALNLVLLGDLVMLSLFQVLLPKASGLKNPGEVRAFLKSFQWLAALAALAVIPVIFLSTPIARMAFGAEYVETGKLFAVLVGGTSVAILCAPAGAAIYATGHSQVIAGLEILKLLCIVIPAVWVVPAFGPMGMAWIVAGVKGGLGLLTYFIALRSNTNSPEGGPQECVRP